MIDCKNKLKLKSLSIIAPMLRNIGDFFCYNHSKNYFLAENHYGKKIFIITNQTLENYFHKIFGRFGFYSYFCNREAIEIEI